MIGWVEFIEAGATQKAVLDRAGHWHCEEAPHIADLLNRDCQPAGDPADHEWGYYALIKAAERLNGTAWLASEWPTN